MFTGFHEKCAWRVSLFSLESQQFSPHASRSHYLISESLQIILKICHFPGRSIKTIQLTLRARNNCFVRYAICSLLIKNVLQMSRFLVWNIFFLLALRARIIWIVKNRPFCKSHLIRENVSFFTSSRKTVLKMFHFQVRISHHFGSRFALALLD